MSASQRSDFFNMRRGGGSTWRDRLTGEARDFMESVEAEMAERGYRPNMAAVTDRLHELGEEVSYMTVNRHFARLSK